MAGEVRKQFNFNRFKRRYIALKILYFGWDYDGLSTQLNNQNTIEFHLFQALTKTCLVESRSQCNYNRCGRTDKGVSSYGQVVNLIVRSNQTDEDAPQNIGLFTPANYTGQTTSGPSENSQELDYVAMLNRVLPEHIKIIAWAPVREEFSSRFSCRGRSYSYIFPIGDLSIPPMQKALSYLVGEHDFRNLCSFDLKNGVTNHKRTILSAHVEPLKTITETAHEASTDSTNHYLFYQMVIVGHAFLYHQIRCIMTVVFLVGTNKESPNVIRDLLDVEKCPGQPNYNRASPLPLCLFDCKYDTNDLPVGWMYNQDAMRNLRRQLKRLWLQYKTKSVMIERVLLDLSSPADQCDDSEEPKMKKSRLQQETWKDFGLDCDNMSDTKYVSLMRRPRGEPLETKLELSGKK